MPSPTLPILSAPLVMTPMTTSTMSSTLSPICMVALPSSDPRVTRLPGDTLLYSQHGPSSITTYIPQYHYPLPPWPTDSIISLSGTDTDMTDAPEATQPNTLSDTTMEPSPIISPDLHVPLPRYPNTMDETPARDLLDLAWRAFFDALNTNVSQKQSSLEERVSTSKCCKEMYTIYWTPEH